MEDKSNTENAIVESTENSNSPVKKSPKAMSVKIQRAKSSHPSTSEMVNTAIKELKDRKGSSLQAIKKYIATNYKVDGEKVAFFIKKYLKSAVKSGAVVQTKGKGASGSFKLPTVKNSELKKILQTVNVSQPKKINKSVEKKTSSMRKIVSLKKKAASPPKKAADDGGVKKAAVVKESPVQSIEKPAKAEKSKAVHESKTLSKSKKTAKAPAVKTKTPKPKKAVASKTVKQVAKK